MSLYNTHTEANAPIITGNKQEESFNNLVVREEPIPKRRIEMRANVGAF